MSVFTPWPLRRRGRPASLRSLLLGALWTLVLAAIAWQALAVYRQLAEAQDARLRAALAGLVHAIGRAPDMPLAARLGLLQAPSAVYRISTAEGDWMAGEQRWAAYPWRWQLARQGVADFYISHGQGQGRLLRSAAVMGQVPGSDPPYVLVQMGLPANAIHHTPRHGRLGMLLRQGDKGAQGGEGAGGAELVVWDEGPGVDDAVFPRLFQPFTATKGGVGLGLSICRQIADAMGATIQIYNRIDQGKVIGVDAVVSWGQGP